LKKTGFRPTMGIATTLVIVTVFVALISTPFVSLLVDGWIIDYIGAVNFSLDQIPDLTGKSAIVTGAEEFKWHETPTEDWGKHAKRFLVAILKSV
jgi:hypothetical protein